MSQTDEKSSMNLTNSRWKRDTNPTNPFKNEKYTPHQNTRWKREKNDSNDTHQKSYNNNSRTAYRPPGQRNERRGRSRFYGRYNREVKKIPKKIPFKLEDENFPGLVSTKSDNNKEMDSDIPIGNWHAAAMKAINQPQPSNKKKNDVNKHFIPRRSNEIDDEIDWSDEEQLPNPVNDIDQYDEQEYESDHDNTDDMIF